MRRSSRFLADQGVDLIVTSGGLGPDGRRHDGRDGGRASPGASWCSTTSSRSKIAAILKPLMARFSHWDFDAVRAANRKQALVPEGAYVIDPVGTAPGVVVPGTPTVVVLPGPAARAPADVAHGGGERAGPGGDRRAHGVPAGDGAHVRPAGVGARGHAARRRGGHRRATTSSRSPPACAAARSRWSRASSRARGAGVRRSCVALARASATGARSSPRTARASTTRWLQLLAGRRVGDGGVVHGRPAGGAADRAPGVVRVRGGRRGGVLERGEGGAAGRRPGADRASTARCPSRWPRRWPRARCAASRPTRRWRSRASRGPDGGTEEKPVGHGVLERPD